MSVAASPTQSTRPLIDPGSDGTPEQQWCSEFERRNLPLLQLRHPKRVLMISPHPDDEVLAAGGLLRQLAASGARVELAAVTDGEAAFGAPDPRLAARRICEL
ncbi:MAG: hypothetical protein QOJ19_3255 [Acidimicrobiia bacterium]|nr:hypothetical protein [Acidimicrobiia bacterium]